MKPSRCRRLGREAYEPEFGSDYMRDGLNPWKNGQAHVWNSVTFAEWWDEGWEEAKSRGKQLVVVDHAGSQLKEWKAAVTNDETILGFEEWAQIQIEGEE